MRARDEFMRLAHQDPGFATHRAALCGLDNHSGTCVRGGAKLLMQPDVKFSPECDYSAARLLPGTAHWESQFLFPTLNCPHPTVQIDRHLFPRIKDIRVGSARHFS